MNPNYVINQKQINFTFFNFEILMRAARNGFLYFSQHRLNIVNGVMLCFKLALLCIINTISINQKPVNLITLNL